MSTRRAIWRRLALLLCVGLAVGRLGAKEPDADSDAGPWLLAPSNRLGSHDLLLLDRAGKLVQKIEGLPHPAYDPTWAPDGRQFAFVAYPHGTAQIFAMNIDDGEVRRLTSTNTREREPRWSPDGRQIVFSSMRTGNEEVFVMDADGSNPRNLTNDNKAFDADPAWSPDGRKIAFVSNRAGRYFRLYVMNADGSEPIDLVKQDLLYAPYPCWSADGQQIIFAGRAPDNSMQLFVINADGSSLEQLTEGGHMSTYAAWSPDGQYVAYVKFQVRPRTYMPDPRAPDMELGDLTIYDTIEGTHTKIGAAESPLVGPRPAWQPQPAGEN